MLFRIAATAAEATNEMEITPPAAVGVIVPMVVVVCAPVVGLVCTIATVITPPTKPAGTVVWYRRMLLISAPAGNTYGVTVVVPMSAVVNTVLPAVVVVIGLVM